MEAHMNNPMLVKELVEKLSSQYKLNWAMFPKSDETPILKTFSDWIFQIADAASTVVSTVPMSEHKISMCNQFKELNLDDKWKFVKENKLCRQCLNKHKRKCFMNTECGIDGCHAKHHRLLHKNFNVEAASSSRQQHENISSGSKNSHSCKNDQQALFRILPIRLQRKGGYIDTFAFLDEGSSVTVIEKDIFDSLDANSVNKPLCLKWTGNTSRVYESSVQASINILNPENGSKYMLNGVHTVENLDIPTQSLDMDDLIAKYPYLAGVSIKSYKRVKPTILIGADNWKIAVPLKIREGLWNQPIATKTRLGWTIQGPHGKGQQTTWLNIHTCECEKNYNELHKLVKEQFNLEESASKSLVSTEDPKSIETLRTTCRKVDDYYEVGLLWKNHVSKLVESYDNAYKRLMCLNKKFSKDPNLKIVLQSQIDNLLAKGYAKKLNAEDINKSTEGVWYLPIFLIKNANKPGKIRMVWDAAAKSNGACLNDYMHSGPDLLKPLVNVLLNFRVAHYVRDCNADQFKDKYTRAKDAIDRISAVEIPRCYSQYLNEATEIELHTFVDAGEDAYAAVCYIRVFSQHQCDVAIIADDGGVLRAKGRTSFLNPEDVVILPANHHVTTLLVRHIHETFHHISHETVINNIKIKYHIPRLRVSTKAGKWFEKTAPLKVGDIVIIIDDNLPRHCWPKGTIVETVIAKDGQVRQATVQTANSVYQRPTTKLAKLDVGITAK
ncbi:uncharacterized protein LOC142224756 [Haematobia irritans]|uniref:uncharacterized protein LOC142224756 n=1 Tax=Haematobia irritans TaxID=7368 RepID=UPI003F4F628E